jgi:hypothetical protein
MRESTARKPDDRGNNRVPAKRQGISPELSEVLHMLNSLEDQFAAKAS